MTSLIKSLSLKNFKGFSDEVHIEFRPVTLLFGANSAGKSSVLHALQYMREILERNNANADRTLQGGDAVDLGGFLNLVHERDRERRIEVEVELVLGDTSIPDLVPDAFEDWQTQEDSVFEFSETLQEIRRQVSTVGVRLTVGWNSLRDEPVVVGYQISTNGNWCVRIEASGDGRDAGMSINRWNPIFVTDAAEDDTDVDLSGDWLDLADPGDSNSALESDDESTDAGESTHVGKVSVLSGLLEHVRDGGVDRPGAGLREWLTGVNGALPRLDQMLYIPASEAKRAEDVYIAREFTAFLSWLAIGPAMLLREQLREMRYIGPLRRIPPRGFDVALTKDEAAWSDGMAAWQSLLSGPQSLVDRCSDWMSNTARLGTGYSITRVPVQEFDLSGPEPQAVGSARKRLRLLDTSGGSHQPQDVGVGISQVLPVVVAAQDGSASVVCIEQPELHVHPAVQVGLGDLFIDGALNSGLAFLIETHSEHLILRLLRRVREAAEQELAIEGPTVTPSLVSVYYLSKEDGHIVASEIPINANGDFDKPWPRGFFEERGPELF
jgi:hypothetical protein